MGPPTRKWVVEWSQRPSPNCSHHRRQAASWDEARQRTATLPTTNLSSAPRRFLSGLSLVRKSKPLRSRQSVSREEEEARGRGRVARMMEEIDRFQVPSAVQDAEMQAEMQPLVRHPSFFSSPSFSNSPPPQPKHHRPAMLRCEACSSRHRLPAARPIRRLLVGMRSRYCRQAAAFLPPCARSKSDASARCVLRYLAVIVFDVEATPEQ